MDDLVAVLLSTSMFIGGTVGFILDNALPGELLKNRKLLQEKYFGNTNIQYVTQKHCTFQSEVYNWCIPFFMK